MEVTFADNTGTRMVDVLAPAISSARRVRLAVAFAKMSGFRMLERAFRDCVDRGGQVEFLLGLDFRTTEPAVLRSILDLRHESRRVALYCFSDPSSERARSYHPKVYFVQNPPVTTTIVGSSNLTSGGLSDNAEVNVIIKARQNEPVVADVLDIYHRLKFQRLRFAPDADYVASYTDSFRRVRQAERTARRAAAVRVSVAATRRKERLLPRPPVEPGDFVGWQRLVLERLPEGEFSTGDIYRFSDDFRRHYPENRNIEPKIRQVLQQLRDLRIIAHVGAGKWRRV